MLCIGTTATIEYQGNDAYDARRYYIPQTRASCSVAGKWQKGVDQFHATRTCTKQLGDFLSGSKQPEQAQLWSMVTLGDSTMYRLTSEGLQHLIQTKCGSMTQLKMNYDKCGMEKYLNVKAKCPDQVNSTCITKIPHDNYTNLCLSCTGCSSFLRKSKKCAFEYVSTLASVRRSLVLRCQ